MIYHNFLNPPTPSISALSKTSLGAPVKPAKIIKVLKGSQCQVSISTVVAILCVALAVISHVIPILDK